MKKRILLYTVAAGMAFITLSSYTTGPAANFQGNLTGSRGGSATCALGCHADNTSTTSATLQLLDNTTSAVVASYTPGVTYKVKLTGSNSTGNLLTHFGFQASATFSTTLANAGTLTAGANMHTFSTSGAVKVVEHSNILSGTGGNNYSATFTWVAPAAGNGTVCFYAMLNAVNADGLNSGDFPNAAPVLRIPEVGSSVATLANNIGVKTFPNPVSNQLNVQITDGSIGTYTLNIFDFSGRRLQSRTVDVSGNNYDASFNTTDLAPGFYGMQIVKDGAQRFIPFVKK